MALIPCPECRERVSDRAPTCPRCGYPIRPQAVRPSYGVDYRSRKTLGGWPLVHIATGVDPETGRPRVARGVIAIGNVAVGGLAVGGVGVGVVSVGGLAAGLLSYGGMALGLLLAVGGLAVGTVAVGGAAVGYVALGGGAFGVHALGGNSSDPAILEFLRRFGWHLPGRP